MQSTTGQNAGYEIYLYRIADRVVHFPILMFNSDSVQHWSIYSIVGANVILAGSLISCIQFSLFTIYLFNGLLQRGNLNFIKITVLSIIHMSCGL